MTLLVTNARLITMTDPDCGYLDHGWLRIDDGRITAVGEGDAPAVPDADVLDVRRAFVAPGFVSSHSHLFTSGARGLGADETLYGWCDSMLGLMAGVSPEGYHWSTLHGALDVLVNGTTTVFDFTDPRIPWPSGVTPGDKLTGVAPPLPGLRPIEHQFAQSDAKAASGLRFLNAASLDDGIGSDDEVLDRFAEVVAHDAGHDRDRCLGTAIMGAVQWSARPNAAELEVAAMRRFGVLNQAHLLETRAEVELQRERFDRYAAAGALGPDFVLGHFVQTTPDIIARAAHAGAGMSWQPAANGRLASGVADLPAIRSAGMRVGIGLDDQACTDVSDPWGNMRIGMYQVRAATGDPAAMTPEAVLRLATLGAAEVLGVDDRVGSLEPGKFADLVVVDPESPDVGPLWHPVRSYVLACGLRNLKRVVVGGATVALNGASLHPLAGEASAKVHELLPAVAARQGSPR